MSKLMHNPPHPGEIIKEFCLDPLDLNITEAARSLGVSRKTLSELINEKSSLSIEMAFRLSMAFGGSPESWLTQQIQYDLWIARGLEKKLKVTEFKKSS